MADEQTLNIAEVTKFEKALREMQAGTYSGSGDIFDYSVYDRGLMLSTRLQHRLFKIPYGQNDPAGVLKTLADTNVQSGNGIPQGLKVMVKWIKIFYSAVAVRSQVTEAAIHAMLRETTANLYLFGKDSYGQWTLEELMGNPMSVAVQTAAVNIGYPAAVGRYLGVYPLQIPIVLASNTVYELTITHHIAPAAGLDGDKLRFSLCGVAGRLS